MDEQYKLISNRDLPDHIDEDIRRQMANILCILQPSRIPVAFGALQGALSYYLLKGKREMRDEAINGLAEGLKKTWRDNEGKTF